MYIFGLLTDNWPQKWQNSYF